VGLVHEDDVDWFLTLDETHHEFSTVGAKGGATAGRYINPSFPRSGERCIVSNFHTTGVYGTTLRGEPLPPLYILSTASLNEDQYKIDPRVCEGLPTVVASYGATVETIYLSYICVRHKGSMDTGLWHQLIRSIYTPLFEGRISPTPIRDPLTMKLLSGPLIVKTDSGPGRLSKEADSIEFREQMAAMGVHILLSLPNATSCTAEMDQLFEKFKPACSKSALRVASKKMQRRMQVRMADVAAKKGGTEVDGHSIDDESDDSTCDDEDDGKRKGRSICNISFTNLDLANLVNGWPGDPIDLRPFDCHFTAKSIIRSWIAVGFLPMTGNAVNDPKVRHELGDGGAPPEAAIRMKALNTEYRKTARVLSGMGFNGGVMDVKLPKVKAAAAFENNEEKIDYLVENRLINKAGGLYKTGTIVANCSVVLEGGRRVAELEKKAKAAVATKKADQMVDLGNNAKTAHGVWVTKGRPIDADGNPVLDKNASYAVVKFLLPRVDILGELKLKDFNSMKKCVKWLGSIGRGMTWDEHMAAALEERRAQLGPPLFSLGGV